MKALLFRIVFCVGMVGAGAPAAVPPFGEQPINFYWRGELYGAPGGWANPGFPMTNREGLSFLDQFHAGLNPVLFWRMQPRTSLFKPDDPSLYFFREVDYDLAATRHTEARSLIQIQVDVPPYWYDSRFPGRASAMDPAYDVRSLRTFFPGDRLPLPPLNPDNPEMMRDADLFVQTTIKRYAGDPNVKGFLVGAGIGQTEMVLSLRGLVYGHGPDEQEAFRRWLREDRGLTLAELGLRWHGRADAFHSWDEVVPPAPYEFFGWDGGTKIALTGHLLPHEDGRFEVRAISDPERNFITEAAETGVPGGWLIDMPQPLDSSRFPEKATLLRREFVVSTAQLEAFRKAGCWLYGEGAMKVVLNGVDLGELNGASTQLADGQPGSYEHGFAFDPFAVGVGKLLREGKNTIALLPDAGLYAPLFLSDEPPRRYPYLGRQRNARYVDWIQWSYSRVVRTHEHFYELARRLAPDAQLVIFSPQGTLLDPAGELARKVGAALRFTGGEAYYFPWYARAGMIAGYPGSVEPSATIRDPQVMLQSLGWWFFNDDQDIAFFYDLANYASRSSAVREVMLRSKKLLGMFGKMEPPPPTLGLLRTSLQFQLDEYFRHPLPFLWDPGRGLLQPTGMDFAYVTETPLCRGLPANIHVLMDTATPVMTPELVDALEKWVKAGGTFVAMQHTGRHGLIEANTWPIQRLTGFSFVGDVPKAEVIHFEPRQTLWPSASGAEQPLVYGGIRLKPVGKDCEIVARWPDGSVAIGLRSYGKGRVVTLGAPFWRDKRLPVAGSPRPTWLGEMLGQLGVRTPVQAQPGSPVWFREVDLKKNGSRALIAFNPTAKALPRVQITWSELGKEKAIDLVEPDDSGPGHLIQNGPDLQVDFAPYQTRLISASQPAVK